MGAEVGNPKVWVSRVSACGDGIDAKPAPLGCFDPLSTSSGNFSTQRLREVGTESGSNAMNCCPCFATPGFPVVDRP